MAMGIGRYNFLTRYIYEYINLAVPITKTHEDADEECDPEMLKFLQQESDGEPPISSNVWDALKGLQSDN